MKQRSTGTSPVDFTREKRLSPSNSNPYDLRFRVDRHASETIVQNIGVGVDADTVRSHMQVQDDMNTTQLLPVQSREKSLVSSLIRDDLQYTPSQSVI